MKLAIVKLSALGDIVHAMVVLQFIKAQNPAISIDWIVEEQYADILSDHPHIDQILTVNLKSLKKNKCGVFRQIKTLRAYADKHYDLVIDAQGLLKSAITARLVGATIAGFDRFSIREGAASWFYAKKVACPYDANTIDRNARVLSKPLGFSISREQILAKQPFLFFSESACDLNAFLRKNKATVVFVIGSTWPSRQYPPLRFVEIAENLAQNCLVIWGNEDERKAAEAMASRSDFITILPKLDLNSLKALIAHADLVIGNDTGPTHMAWALNRPSITIFGPTPISRVYQTAINKVVKSPSIVNPYKLNKQDFSIVDIESVKISDLARELLAMPPASLEHGVTERLAISSAESGA
jgi:heptosyltransferase-1